MSVAALRYEARAEAYAPASAARALLATMVRKRSNLCVSVDVTRAADLLAVVAAVAPHVCLVKTHIDIVSDFSDDLVVQLQALAQQHDFLIFEDRKFADIGNTVSLQYAAGVHKIASWSHITNAHLVPGPGIIDGLAAVGEPLGRSLLLLAEMSSAGTLARGEYSRECVRAAYAHPFVCGFIAMHRVDDDEAPPAGQAKKDFLILTPGVGLDSTGDGRGQQYRTPDEVVRASGCDVIIVGRGIYGALLKEGVARADAIAEVTRQGERYRDAGWQAYEARLAAAAGPSAGVSSSAALPMHVFGYGSLIFKPPPYTVARTVGYIRGFVRRFAQSSIDHRGTHARPGRVVTLVEAKHWRAAEEAARAAGHAVEEEELGEDIVWGVCWTIDPSHAADVRAYLDHREINGYTPQQVSVYGRAAPDAEQDSVLMRDVLVYVGLPDNEAFVGPAPSQTHLAARIFSCAGPSGRNDEYVLRLARATRALAPQVTDRHLFDLEERLLALRRAEGLPELGEDVVDADREQRILEEVLQRAASRPP